MNSWQQLKLRDVAQKDKYGLVDGPFGSNLPASVYTTTGVPVVRGVNLSLGQERFRDHNYVFVSDYTANRLKRSLCKPHDIIFTKKGTLGQTGIIPKDTGYSQFLLSSNQMKLSVDIKKADALYVYYFVSSPHSRQRILIDAMTTGVPKTNLTYLRNFPILLPTIQVQKDIAAILSAYDDLIENNKRRVVLLEKMAEEIYREWFVRIRFPGHGRVAFNKGVPDGWEKVKLEKAFKFTGGGTPSKKNGRYWDDGNVNWFTPSDITSSRGIFLNRSGERCTDEGFSNSSARLFPAYSIMMTSRATIGAIGINTTPACTNQGFITCIPNERYPLEFLYHWLILSKPHFKLLAGGATFAELTKTTFKRIEILTPPKGLVSFFADKVAPLLKAIEKLLQTNVNLENTRDMLLSRLIAGKLSVEKLDIHFPPSMQNEQDVDHAQFHLRR